MDDEGCLAGFVCADPAWYAVSGEEGDSPGQEKGGHKGKCTVCFKAHGEGRELFLHSLLNCLQKLKTILMPKWPTLGCQVVIPSHGGSQGVTLRP